MTHRNGWTQSLAVLAVVFCFHGAASASSWTVVGTPATGRWGHQSFLLSDGKVMSTGGRIPISLGYMMGTETVELFNPATNQWSPAPNMLSKRALHAQAPLPNGDFLMNGGAYSNIIIERYSLATGTSVVPGNSPDAREGATLTPLLDGKVLLVGGVHSGCCSANNPRAWIYDPAATTSPWVLTTSLIKARISHTATRLPNGDVLIVGGRTISTGPELTLDFTERYSSGGFSDAGPLTFRRSDHTATRLSDGRVLVLGGYIEFGGAFASTPEIYDGVGTWTQATPPPQFPNRLGHTTTLLQDGRVLLVGGVTAWSMSWDGTTAVEIYNPTTNTWSAGPSLTYGRNGHTATLLSDGRVLIDGGNFDAVLPSEIFTP